jgi:transcriptional regulator with XRE-family HTH domain
MSVNINDKIRTLSPARQRRIEARAAELIAEEMSLRDLRKARKLTQVRLAEMLGVNQDSVSRLEKRSDLLVSTLRKTVKAMGGDVRIVVDFPDRAPVILSQLAEVLVEPGHAKRLSFATRSLKTRRSSRRRARA